MSCVSLTLVVSVVGRSNARSAARNRTTFSFLSTLKLDNNFAWDSLTSCYLCSSNSCRCSTDSASIVGSIILLWETSEWSLEPDIEGRSDGSSRLVPSGVAKKCVGVDLDGNHCKVRCSLRQRGRSAAYGRSGFFSTPKSDSSHLVTGRSACVQRWRRSPTTPGSDPREGPRHGGEILEFGLVLVGHQDVSRRRRAKERWNRGWED
jgi:hypothetical protein